MTLYQHISKGLEEGQIKEFFPLKNNGGSIRRFLDEHSQDAYGGTLASALNLFGYEFFKQDELGTFMECLLCAGEKMQSLGGRVPVLGIQTYSAACMDGIGDVRINVCKAYTAFNSALSVYET